MFNLLMRRFYTWKFFIFSLSEIKQGKVFTIYIVRTLYMYTIFHIADDLVILYL
jgi:hypothetical protein